METEIETVAVTEGKSVCLFHTVNTAVACIIYTLQDPRYVCYSPAHVNCPIPCYSMCLPAP